MARLPKNAAKNANQKRPNAVGEEQEGIIGKEAAIEPAGSDHPFRRPDGGPVDPASSFAPGTVLPSSALKGSPGTKKKLNDLGLDDPERKKIPPEEKL